MISSDDHPPPDPSSSDYQNHHRHLQNGHDLKINSDEKPHASVYDIDLLKSLAPDLDDTNNPLPGFSIRDYVFNLRSKDIACNWPFSRKNLQICLQHGVKNLLPPFQSLELLRHNSSVSRCTVENRPSEVETVSASDGKPIDDQFVSVTFYGAKPNLDLVQESLNTNSSGSKGEKEFQSHLQKDLAYTKSKKIPLVSSRKTEKATVQPAIKKCRLGVKLNTGVEPAEEVTTNNFIVSETMASKVCPVCKIFSSSSNTTLNAHIDQCLSGESSMKWTANPKVIVRHRKTRLMVDIYETAPHCTVEELDARNGTSWANNSSFPAQELEFQGEEKEKHKETTFTPDVTDHEGAVYIDTDGTKVRILSVPKVGTSDDHGARDLLKGGKLSKFFMGKKEYKNHEHKHQKKYLKLSPNSKKSCSRKPHRGASSEVTTGRIENLAIGGSCNKEDQDKQPINPEPHMKMDDLPIIRPPWACSKRTGLAKKFSGSFHIRHNAAKNLTVASDRSSSVCGLISPPSLSDNMSSQQSRPKMGTVSPCKEQPPMSNRVEFSSRSPVSHYAKKRSRLLTKPSSKHSRREGILLDNSCEDPLDAYPSKHSDGSDVRSKGSKFSSSRKNLLAVSREPASKFNLKRKFSALKRSCAHCMSKENAVVVPSQDSLKRQSRMEEGTSGKMWCESMNLLEVRKKEETKICRQENSAASESSNEDSSARLETDLVDPLHDVESVREEIPSYSEQVCTIQAPRGIDTEGSSMALSNSLNLEFPKLVNQPDNMLDSQECVELGQGDQLCSPKHAQDDKEMYCADFIKKSMHIDDVTDDIERHQNYFEEVEPIPIPGPPGSFLPSPGGDVVSEELQGNSSLTTMSRVQSSEDQHHHDMVDRDSMSDSPISTISNPSLARLDSRCTDKFPVRSASLKEDTRSFSGATIDGINEKYAPVTISTNAGDWRSVHTIFTEKGPLTGFKNDQPCCCSRKDGISPQTVASSYHESTLVRKHAVESLNFRPEMFSIRNYPTSQAPVPETVISPPTMKLPADSSVKLPVYSEYGSAGSPSKPVLRLMGKNLTVVKTDEDVSSSQQFRCPPQLSPVGQLTNVQNEYNSSSPGYHPQHSILFSNNLNGSKSQHPNVQPLNNLRSRVDLTPIHALDTMFRSSTSVDCYSHGSHHLGPRMPQARASQGRNKLDGQMVSGRNMHKASSKSIKEIIIIDDSPEGEGNDAMHMRRNWASLSSSIPGHNHMPSGYDSQSSAQVLHNGGNSLAFRNGSFEACLPFREVADNGNLGKWNRTPAGSSSMLKTGSLGSPSPSASHLRSSIYYPPSFL